MAMIDKQIFISTLQEALSDKLTQKDIISVSDAVMNCLAGYDVERREVIHDTQDFEEHLKLFINAKRIEGRSPKTLERYAYILKRLFKNIDVPMRQVSVFHLRSYLMDEKERGISDSTLRGYRDVFNSFFGWLYNEGLIKNNPCANLNSIKCRKKVRLPFSDVEIEKLKEACDNARDKAIIAFLLASGCRISEVCGTGTDSIDFVSKECTVLGKGNKERTVFLDDVSAMQIKNYLSRRDDDLPALFTGRGTERMTPHGVRKLLNIIAERAGVENVHPHRFRRTLATNLVDRGMPIQEVAAILGHEKIDTTMTYVFIDKENVKNSYRKYA